VCVQAAEKLASDGIAAEVIDLRTIKPLDTATVLASARRTGRVVIVHEASQTCGVGAEIAALVAEHAFDDLMAPVQRITGPDAPAPASHALEQAFVPSIDRVVEACRRQWKLTAPVAPRTLRRA
jgi:pyruvate dehydrogenase E1 component beta subunit